MLKLQSVVCLHNTYENCNNKQQKMYKNLTKNTGLLCKNKIITKRLFENKQMQRMIGYQNKMPNVWNGP